jgi:myosin heavy subunit
MQCTTAAAGRAMAIGRCTAQTKTVETTIVGIQTGNDPNLPPLMNPAMLEASDDLTNLSHLNEPAGKDSPRDTGNKAY